MRKHLSSLEAGRLGRDVVDFNGSWRILRTFEVSQIGHPNTEVHRISEHF